MTEPDYVDDEEIFSEDEIELESIDFKTYLKYGVISFGRQLYCASSVLIFPILYSLHTDFKKTLPFWIIINKDDDSNDIDEDKTTNANMIIYSGHTTMVSSIGQIVSVISLNFLGRKYTVAVANLLYLVTLIHSYRIADLLVDEVYPYEVAVAHVFVREFSFTPYFIYLAEITSPTWRAFFMGLFLFERVATDRHLDQTWEDHELKRMFSGYVMLTFASLILALYLPETPFYETLDGNREKAEETFTWLRAGVPDMLEFDAMTEQAENIENNGILQHLRSRTFLLCLILSFFIVMCSFYNSCYIMNTFLHDLYVPQHIVPEATISTTTTITTKDTRTIASVTKNTSANITTFEDAITTMSTKAQLNSILWTWTKNWPYSQICILFLFLIYSLVVPRKIIFLVSYVLTSLVIAIVVLQPGSLDFLISVARYCDLPTTLGLTNLVLIWPTEEKLIKKILGSIKKSEGEDHSPQSFSYIYPAALRDIGVAIVAIWSKVNIYLFYLLAISGRKDFPARSINRWMSYGNYFGSLIGFLFILMFLPETRKMNIYQLDELHLRLTFLKRKEKPVGSDSGTESEIEIPDEDETLDTEGDSEKDEEKLEEIGTSGPVT